jgi:hypothetical protein
VKKNSQLPSRPKVTLKFDSGDKKVISFRFPVLLIKELQRESKAKGYSVNEVAQFVLDQYFQSEN